MRVYMQTPLEKDQTPRYYQLLVQEDLLEGWTLIREWGRQGAPGRIKRDHFATLEETLTACIKVRDTQLNKGYQVVFSKGQELHT
ncbi:MAG: WGR domain-containing protein [Gammaproteobacteria bacterium]|nr:WGR domain-containing protein [Gammaproteobacteria bacterium]